MQLKKITAVSDDISLRLTQPERYQRLCQDLDQMWGNRHNKKVAVKLEAFLWKACDFYHDPLLFYHLIKGLAPKQVLLFFEKAGRNEGGDQLAYELTLTFYVLKSAAHFRVNGEMFSVSLRRAIFNMHHQGYSDMLKQVYVACTRNHHLAPRWTGVILDAMGILQLYPDPKCLIAPKKRVARTPLKELAESEHQYLKGRASLSEAIKLVKALKSTKYSQDKARSHKFDLNKLENLLVGLFYLSETIAAKIPEEDQRHQVTVQDVSSFEKEILKIASHIHDRFLDYSVFYHTQVLPYLKCIDPAGRIDPKKNKERFNFNLVIQTKMDWDMIKKFDDYMIVPIQRLAKYPLLLKEISKHYEASPNLHQAWKRVAELFKKIAQGVEEKVPKDRQL